MNISLIDFDKNFYNNLNDKNKIKVLLTKGLYYTILIDNIKIGIVGYIGPFKRNNANAGLVQILLKEEYRGKDLIGKIYQKMVNRDNLNCLFATIKENNIISIKAHKKIGFRKMNYKLENQLRKSNKLRKGFIRLIKIYKK